MQDTVTPKAMTLEEVQDTISDYAHAAKCAIAAGFDGVELHGANGYLIDQFINSNINLRTDAYGGDRVKRARFAVEVVDAVIAALDGDAARVGIRFSPFGTFQGTNTEDPVMDYGYVMSQLDNKGLAYIHLIEPGGGSGSYFGMPDYKLDILKAGAASRGVTNLEDEVSLKPFRKILKHTTLLGNGAYLSSGGADVEDRLKEGGLMDAAVYGRYFISNPDLPERLRLGRELNAYDRTTFYSHGREGYTDYPTWDELQAQKEKSRI